MTSSITLQNLQIDGRRLIHEQHIDATGKEHQVQYVAEATTDLAEMLTLHAALLQESLTQAEIDANVQEVLP